MKRILIIGHGQLGLMMAAESARLGLQVDRLDLATGEVIGGTSSLRKKIATQDIINHYDIITCELEHLPDSDTVTSLVNSDKWINREALTILPNRQTQKELLDRLNLPSAPWVFLNASEDTENARQQLGEQLIVKTIRGGYDGKGQWRIKSKDDRLPDAIYGGAIAEQKIDFNRELSIIGARNNKGQIAFMPLAENTHHEGILRYSRAGHIDDQSLTGQALTILTSIMNELNYIGVMAVECFDCDGTLLINEVAPRVHNSGHWSQLGAPYNQFYWHLLALIDFDIPPNSYEETIMLNLIGCEFNPSWLNIAGVDVHWYGKEVRPNRKLGHINIGADNEDTAQTLMPLLDDDHAEFLRAAFV